MYFHAVRASGIVGLLAALLCIAAVPSVFAQAADSAPAIGSAELPRDLSPWGMFVAADILVKAVLMGLVAASVITWTVWLAKSIELLVARRRARRSLRFLASARHLGEALAVNPQGRSESSSRRPRRNWTSRPTHSSHPA